MTGRARYPAQKISRFVPARFIRKPIFICLARAWRFMALKGLLPDLLIVVSSCILAVLLAVLLQPFTGRYDAVLFVLVLVLLLWVAATKRGWPVPVSLPFVRSSVMSEILLGLVSMIVALAVSWFIGNALSRTYSDLVGIPVGLVIFGIIMLGVSSLREWQ
jgi:hypothetical protein